MNNTQSLTPAQETLLKFVVEGGQVKRSIGRKARTGYFVPESAGIKLLLPATVNTLIDRGLLEMTEANSTAEVYEWTGILPAEDQPEPAVDTAADEITLPAEEPTEEEPEEPATNDDEEVVNDATAIDETADYLMWVGEMHYPRIQDFLDEAEIQGVSKRLSRFPREMVPGKSRVFLAHDEGQTGRGVIFGYFTVERLEVLNINPLEPLPVHNRNDVTFLGIEDLAAEKQRGCGYRNAHGARYATSLPNIDEDAMREIDAETMAHGPLVVFKRPVVARSVGIKKRFRSFIKVNANTILFRGERTNVLPYEAARTELNIPELKDLEVNPTGRWTEAERDALRRMVERYDSPFRAINDFATVTGRSKAGVTYQWYNRLRPPIVEEGDDE